MRLFDIPLLNDSYSLSLYVHIPFCSKKCSYCNFFSVPLVDENIAKKVLEETLEQGKYLLSALDATTIKTIYIGGGTPSILNRKLLDRFISDLKAMTGSATGEWTIEANPESLDEDFIDVCGKNGISRISLGLQSFNADCLRFIGRNAVARDNENAVRLLKKTWEKDLNVDLIAGIPGQTKDSLQSDIRSIIKKLDPDHISFYSLTIEEGTELDKLIRNNKKEMLMQTKQDYLWLTGYRMLEQAGYKNYEISNFSKPGKECRHNLRYWRMEPYVGIGPGAVSTLPMQGGRVVRLENTQSIDSFLIGRDRSWNIKQETITLPEFLLENVMMGLRLKEGISKTVFDSRFGIGLDRLLGDIWEGWEKKHYTIKSGNHYRLTQKARLLLDSLLLECSDYLETTGNTVRTLQWPERFP